MRTNAMGLAVCCLLSLPGCGGDPSSSNSVTPPPPIEPGNETSVGENEPAADLPPADVAPEEDTASPQTPEEAIAEQLELLKAQDVDALKQHFTERVRGGVTAESVSAAQDQAGGASIDDLIASVELGEVDGQETAKIIMPNERTLTTLIKVDGHWLADTIWFK